MRRKDKEVVDREFIDSVMSRSQVCRIGLCQDGVPYIVPMCFGYDGESIYLHSAKEGRKIDFLKSNPAVCFEIDIDCELKPSDKPCSFSMKYRSVMGYGEVSFIEDEEDKRRALGIILKHYDSGGSGLGEVSLEKISVFRIDIAEMTAKKSGY